MASIHLLYLSSSKQGSFCYLLSFPFSLFFSCWSFCSRCCFSSSCSCRCCSNFLWCSSSSCWCFIASISCCCCGEGTREKEKINKVRLIEGKTAVTISQQRCCLGHRNRKDGIFVVQRLYVLCSLISGSLHAVLLKPGTRGSFPTPPQNTASPSWLGFSACYFSWTFAFSLLSVLTKTPNTTSSLQVLSEGTSLSSPVTRSNQNMPSPTPALQDQFSSLARMLFWISL